MEPLGPFQPIWNAWNDAAIGAERQTIDDFRGVIEAQFVELNEHLDAGDRQRAAFEAIDIISVALTILRWLDLTPDEIATLAEHRARERMQGQVNQILKKYNMLK